MCHRPNEMNCTAHRANKSKYTRLNSHSQGKECTVHENETPHHLVAPVIAWSENQWVVGERELMERCKQRYCEQFIWQLNKIRQPHRVLLVIFCLLCILEKRSAPARLPPGCILTVCVSEYVRFHFQPVHTAGINLYHRKNIHDNHLRFRKGARVGRWVHCAIKGKEIWLTKAGGSHISVNKSEGCRVT